MDSPNRVFLIGLARAVGGATLFSIPMMMTMEMWFLSFYMKPLRMAALVIAVIPLLTGLAYYSGFEERVSLKGSIVDAFVAYAVGFATAFVILALLSVVDLTISIGEIIGKVSLLAIPGGFGAVLAASQLGDRSDPSEHTHEGSDQASCNTHADHLNTAAKQTPLPPPDRKNRRTTQSYYRELFLMLTGALVLSFNIAPTEEVVLIAFKMTAWHAIALMLVSMIGMHAFVYVVKFRGQETKPEDRAWWSMFLRFTVVGYAITLLISLFCLWIFSRTDGTGFSQVTVATIVLAFPGAMGAAAARLIL
jgi:putative integral membrane protein (TIGR02587 family)